MDVDDHLWHLILRKQSQPCDRTTFQEKNIFNKLIIKTLGGYLPCVCSLTEYTHYRCYREILPFLHYTCLLLQISMLGFPFKTQQTQCWKSANIKPIPKCKAPQHIKDFRPIALTPTLAKCFERLTVKYFQPLVTDTRQFAYKQNNCTFILLIDTISEHPHLNAQNYVRGVFINF